MTTAKSVILTAIKFKGLEQVKQDAKELSESSCCTEQYVRSIIRNVERSQIIISCQNNQK